MTMPAHTRHFIEIYQWLIPKVAVDEALTCSAGLLAIWTPESKAEIRAMAQAELTFR
jgi:hypothetical protein